MFTDQLIGDGLGCRVYFIFVRIVSIDEMNMVMVWKLGGWR